MGTKIGIGFSRDIDTATAAQNAAISSSKSLASKDVHLAIVFSSIHYDPQTTIPIIQQTLNCQRLIGASTAGIILQHSIETRGIGILTITSDEMNFGTSCVVDALSGNPIQVGTSLANEAISDFGQHARQAFLFFMDSELHITSEFLNGLQQVYGNVFPIIGAGCSDDFHYEKTFQILNGNIYEHSVTGLLMGGQMTVGAATRHGWRPLGKPRIITAVEHNVIKSIDGKKASHLYDEFFGEYADDLRSQKLGRMAILYPLGIDVEGSNEYLLRNTVDITSEGDIICQGDLLEGSEVHVMIGNKNSCKAAVREAAIEAQKSLLGRPAKLVLVIECLSRLKLFGRAAFDEIKIIKDVFGGDTPIFGMYSNGEVCPLKTEERFKRPHHQNESVVVLAIG